jgi:ketosteroid isomerase-like protein
MDAGEAASSWAAIWTAAWRAHDFEPIVALYADDRMHRSTPFRRPTVDGRVSVTTSPGRCGRAGC